MGVVELSEFGCGIWVIWDAYVNFACASCARMGAAQLFFGYTDSKDVCVCTSKQLCVCASKQLCVCVQASNCVCVQASK